MSTLDQIIYDGLADWRVRDSEQRALATAREIEKQKNEGERVRRVLKLLLGLDLPGDSAAVEIDGYQISLNDMRDSFDHNYETLYITKPGLRQSNYFVFGGYIVKRETEAGYRLLDRDQFLLNFQAAKQAVDNEIARLANPPTTPPTPTVNLDADQRDAIYFCKELIDSLETGWTLTERQAYVMATIRYTSAIHRWVQRTDE